MKKVLFIFGTRPEAVKMAPLVKMLAQKSQDFEIRICSTGQHKEMLQQIMLFFDIKADYDLELMKPNQTLFDITADSLRGIEKVLSGWDPDWIIVQGDTTTAFTGALAGFYKKIKVAHLEAGLRSYDRYSPFPEEINRSLISHLAELHLAPTAQAAKNLSNEGIQKNVHVVTNTVIDALLLGLKIIKQRGESEYSEYFNYLNFNKKIVLITAHRRESFGDPFEQICSSIRQLAEKFPDIQFIYPVHLNPNVQEPVKRILSGINNIRLIPPLDYQYLIWLMSKSYLILTDSGGIQEEAPALGKPVLVLRDVTERQEGVDAGTAKLVGTNAELIISEASKLITDQDYYQSMSNAVNPYGTGHASELIANLLRDSD